MFASLSACSFPSIFICVLTLWKVVGLVRVFNISTMFDSKALSAWLLCLDGCLICVFRL